VTPAPQPITTTVFACFGTERRQVSEHALQAHVLRLARRLAPFRRCDSCRTPFDRSDTRPMRSSFAAVDDLRLAKLGRGVAAVRDEHTGYGVHAEHEQTCQSARHREATDDTRLSAAASAR
jgi:hypothetical protein